MVNFRQDGFLTSVFLALLSSMFSGAFFIIALKGVSIFNSFMFFSVVSIFEFLLIIFVMFIKHRKIAFPRKRYIFNGFVYTIATLLFLSIMNRSNLVLLSEIITTNILVFMGLQIAYHKDIVHRGIILKLLSGGIVAIIAILVVYGFDSAKIGTITLLLTIVLTLLYGIANYWFSHNSKHSYTKTNFIFWLILFQLLITTSATVMFGFALKPSFKLLFYGFIGALTLFASLFLMIYSYQMIKEYAPVSRLISTSVLFILSETDVVFISVFYDIFVKSLNIATICSLALLLFAIYILSTVEEKIEK